MRTTTHRGRRGLFAGVTALALLLAACGDDDDSSSDETEAPAATEAPAESEAPAGTEAQGGGEVSGSITITGSSTVEPISTAIGNAFADANPDVAVTVEGPGTGTHRSPRLHFRRGHWRHYEDHKTWIRWQMVGNPDLGFVEKQYRL